MSKLPDFKELTDKLDLDSIISNVKSIVNPESQTPHPDEGDKVGQMLADCNMLSHDIAQLHEEIAKKNNQLAIKLNKLFKELRKEPKVKESEAKSKANAANEAKAAKAHHAEKPKEKPAEHVEHETKAHGKGHETKKEE